MVMYLLFGGHVEYETALEYATIEIVVHIGTSQLFVKLNCVLDFVDLRSIFFEQPHRIDDFTIEQSLIVYRVVY